MTTAASAPKRCLRPERRRVHERHRGVAGAALPLRVPARLPSLRRWAPPPLLRARRPGLGAPRDDEALSLLPAPAANHARPAVAGTDSAPPRRFRPPTNYPTGDTVIKIVDRLRNRSLRGEAGDPGSAEAGSADEQRLPIARYDQLHGNQVIPHLSHLELAAVDAHERSHRNRPVVLDRLRWLRGSEPLPGYDALDSDAIIRALPDADAATVKAVRSYERHHRDRREVRAEAARVLRRHGQAPDRIAPAKTRPRSSKPVFGPDPAATTVDPDGPPAIKTDSHRSPFDRVDAAQEERNERERLRDDARYRRDRLDLYRARLYGGRPARQGKLRELQRASDGAAARLRRAEAAAPPTHPPT
jgi:hypothetical protein